MKPIFLLFSAFLLFVSPVASFAEPPFENSFDIGSNVFNEGDMSIAYEVVYLGMEERTVYDSRYQTSETADMHIFTTTYADGQVVEWQVNGEFDEISAQFEVEHYAYILGQMPLVLRINLERVTIHKGNELWAGGGHSVIIYSETANKVMNIEEEVMFHELVHVSLDQRYRDTDGWLSAQVSDGEFISNYALAFPEREDMAESFLAHLAVRARRDRIPDSVATAITDAIPARVKYFDALNLNMEPLVEYDFHINAGLSGAWYEPTTSGQGQLLTVLPKSGIVFLAWFTFDTERPPAGATAFLGGPGQRWITAQGPYEGNVATLTVYQTTGGVFNEQYPKPVTGQEGDGTIILEFSSCSEALLSYEITSLGISGEIPIQRIAHDNVPLCESGLFD